MIKLIRADFSRLFRSAIFWAAVVAVLGFAFFCINEERNMVSRYYLYDETLFIGTTLICFPIAIVISTFTGADYRFGTIRNKLSVGVTRAQIYFSKFIVCTVASLMLHALWLIAVIGSSAVGIVGSFEMSYRNLAMLIFISIVTIIAFSSVFLFISMIIPSISLSIIAVMIVAGSMMYLSEWLDMRLGEPEYIVEVKYVSVISSYKDEYGNDIEELETEEREYLNPKYVSGFRRKVYEFFFNAIPNSQVRNLSAVSSFMAVYMDMDFWGPEDIEELEFKSMDELVNSRMTLPLYSLIVIFVTTVAGLAIFRVENIR